jgi:preprotein translocase subunit SecY
MKLVDDARDWSKWWSVRLSIVGGALLTFLEAFPHAVATVISTLPSEVTGTIDEGILKAIGIICILASPVARVIKQNKLDEADTKAAKKR